MLFPHLISRMIQNLKSVFGIPDYGRYVQHQRRHHPGQPLLSEKEFFLERLNHKYGGKERKPASRC